MMNANRTRLLLVAMTMFSVPSAFAVQNLVCGPDPAKNTKVLQDAINRAKPIDTLVLPRGVCVVAKCAVADPTASCSGASGKHSSALYIGNRANSNLDIVGDASGTSVLKLDPNPPRLATKHPYCSDTHLVTVEAISHVTFRGFTIDGSHSNLPDDSRECPTTGAAGKIEFQGFEEHMHGLYIRNAADVEIVDMKITNAHGDGLNLIASLSLQPLTQGIIVRDSQFLGNKRSGIGFQRNVRDVAITNNTFRNSGTDQDLDMEPTGGGANEGPTNIDITSNRFERAKAGGVQASGIAVTLGAGGTLPGHGIRFTGNKIVPAAGSKTPYGGCIFVYDADAVTIKDNTVIGTDDCFPVQGRKVQGLTIEGNEMHGYRNRAQDGLFRPAGVVWLSVDTGKVVEECTSMCEYRIHYVDEVIIRNNRMFQHVQLSSGIALEGADGVSISDNQITATNEFAPVGTVPADSHSAAVAMTLGVHPLGAGSSFYSGERKTLKPAWVDSNTFTNFKNAVSISRYPGTTINSLALTRNTLSSNVPAARGIYLRGESAFVTSLTVDRNCFGCGFVAVPPELGSNAFVRPADQAFKGDIGSATPGTPAQCLKPSGQ
jgi:nitrous oxidase accessory protein NosD